MQGTIKDLRLIQCFAWFLLIFWVVVATTSDEKIKGEERRKREIQENITKTRLTQKIDNSNPYQSIQSILPGQQAYPVQFEPLAHIRLSRSTYKVTTFIEFKPYISSFLRFQRFLELFLADLVDPSRVSIYKHILAGHMTSQERTLITRVITRDKCSQTQEEVCSEETVKVDGRQILSQAECKKQFQLICRAVRQFKAITRAAEYIRRTFNEIKREFLSVIDHLETEAEEKDPRERRQSNEKVQEELKIAYSRVSKEELEVLDGILKQVEEKYPDLNEKVLKRTKRFGVMSWIMGWGIYSNWRQIKAIKKNIKKLYEQNLLQEQQIQDLAHYLNLTATRVQLHDKMLYNIQVRLNRIDHSIGTLNDIVTFNWVSNNMLLDANVIVNRLITGLIVLRNNVERIYRYLNVIASQEVNPVMIPPPPLRQLLAEVQEEMKSNPRLMLPYDPQTEIYKFYEVMKITPVVVEDVLSMLLTIPLIDKSLQMNMYRVHNLPALHTKLGVAAEYILEGDYLAVDEHGLYVALPDAREIQICLTSQGGLCVMNQALHPVETVEWCVYALFIQDEQRIKRDCSMNFKPRKANVAQSMGGYLWAVSSLVGEKMQVRCLTETHVEIIKPPLQVIHIGNGCEGYSPSIKIPAKSELTSQNDIAERTTYFLDFNAQYEKSKDMGPWNLFELDKFTEKKLKGMVDMLPALPPMNYDNLNKRIGELDDYPLEIPVAIIAIILVVSTVFLVATLVVYAYIIFRLRKNIKILFPMAKLLTGQATGSEAQEIKRMLLTLLEIPAGQHCPPPLPLRPTRLAITPAEATSAQTISSTGAAVVVKDKIELLTTPKQIKRYEKYLVKQKEKLQEDTKL